MKGKNKLQQCNACSVVWGNGSACAKPENLAGDSRYALYSPVEAWKGAFIEVCKIIALLPRSV